MSKHRYRASWAVFCAIDPLWKKTCTQRRGSSSHLLKAVNGGNMSFIIFVSQNRLSGKLNTCTLKWPCALIRCRFHLDLMSLYSKMTCCWMVITIYWSCGAGDNYCWFAEENTHPIPLHEIYRQMMKTACFFFGLLLSPSNLFQL